MEQKIARVIGHATKEVLHAFVRALRAVLISGVVVFIVVALATEVIAAILTQQIIPSGLTHLVAAALGVAFAYAVAITVAFLEMLRAMITIIELAIKESEKLAEEAVQVAEKAGQFAERELAQGAQAAVREGAALAQGASHLAGNVASGAVHSVQSVEQGAAGLIGGAAHGMHSMEQGVTSHLPFGHRENAQ